MLGPGHFTCHLPNRTMGGPGLCLTQNIGSCQVLPHLKLMSEMHDPSETVLIVPQMAQLMVFLGFTNHVGTTSHT